MKLSKTNHNELSYNHEVGTFEYTIYTSSDKYSFELARFMEHELNLEFHAESQACGEWEDGYTTTWTIDAESKSEFMEMYKEAKEKSKEMVALLNAGWAFV